MPRLSPLPDNRGHGHGGAEAGVVLHLARHRSLARHFFSSSRNFSFDVLPKKRRFFGQKKVFRETVTSRTETPDRFFRESFQNGDFFALPSFFANKLICLKQQANLIETQFKQNYHTCHSPYFVKF